MHFQGGLQRRDTLTGFGEGQENGGDDLESWLAVLGLNDPLRRAHHAVAHAHLQFQWQLAGYSQEAHLPFHSPP